MFNLQNIIASRFWAFINETPLRIMVSSNDLTILFPNIVVQACEAVIMRGLTTAVKIHKSRLLVTFIAFDILLSSLRDF
jgi:hypothetical protein